MDVSDVEESANIACLSLLPEKSKKRYEAAYKSFKNWCQTKTASAVSETLLLAYFYEKSAQLKSPSSLWCEYSMLKSTLFIKENIDISKYPKLRAFLKRKNDGYRPKKSNVFDREDVNKFMLEAPDEIYLLMKVVMVMGVAGACRCNELSEMKMDNVKITQDVILVTIPDSKNGMSRTFTVTKSDENRVCHFKIIQKYIDIRSHMATNNQRFFMRYQNGKCLNQPVGKNTLSSIPSKIAKFLQFENFKMYTGHSFRRTSATLLANTGVDVLAIKRHGGWKSANIAESYVAESLNNKKEVANKILYNKTRPEVSCTSSTVTETLVRSERSVESENVIHIEKKRENVFPNFVNNVNNCNNCTININFN